MSSRMLPLLAGACLGVTCYQASRELTYSKDEKGSDEKKARLWIPQDKRKETYLRQAAVAYPCLGIASSLKGTSLRTHLLSTTLIGGSYLFSRFWFHKPDVKTVSESLQGTEHTFEAWRAVPEEDQQVLQEPLATLALGEDKPFVGLWDDHKVHRTLSEEGFQLGSTFWQLDPVSSLLTASNAKGTFTFDLSQVKVAHHKHLKPSDVQAYLKLEDVHEEDTRRFRGERIAIRGSIAFQYKIRSSRLMECEDLVTQDMIWACWPNASHKDSATQEDLMTYKQQVENTLQLLHSLANEREMISIVVPRAFMPERYQASDSLENFKEAPLYYAYRSAFLEAVDAFSASTKQTFIIHALQENERQTISFHSPYSVLAPIDADCDITSETLVDQGFRVIQMCTGDQTGHIGNVAQYNLGGSAKDERDARLAMVPYLSIFSGIVNPHLLDPDKYERIESRSL